MNFFDSMKGKVIWEGMKLILLLSCLGLIIYFNLFFKQEEIVKEGPSEFISETEVVESKAAEGVEMPKAETVKLINVDLKGAVKKEGVYTVQEGSTVNDIIKLSGGIKSNGTLKNINLSKRLEDEMVIYVFSKSEMSKMNNTVKTDTACTTNVINYDNCITTEKNATETSTSLVNINTASKEELMTVSGIGASKADSIIAYRIKTPFSKIEDIMNVSGIGESLFDKIKKYITV